MLYTELLPSPHLPSFPPPQDILSAMAYGTPAIRQKALDLLLYYWPIPIPEFSQRSNSIYRGMVPILFHLTLNPIVCLFVEWSTPVCENSRCPHKNSVASMVSPMIFSA